MGCFKIGDKVIKNPATWEINVFDKFGRGVGTGEVVTPPFPVDDLGMVDVRWAGGRYFEYEVQLLAKSIPDDLETNISK